MANLGATIRKAIVAAAALALGSCASTGGPLGISDEQGLALGNQEHPKILAAFGGELDDPQLTSYVRRIHQKLLAASATPGAPQAPIQITLLDSPVVNAMALPGHVYVTRGLLALANSEAEVAGVIGHEIGHIYERHTAQRISRGNLAGLGAAAVAILTGDQDTAQMAGQAAQLYLLKFSRTQEYEADMVGVRMMAGAGYDPIGQAEFLDTLGKWSALEGQIAGAERPPEFLSTHPNTPERVRRAAAEAQVRGAGNGAGRDRDVYLANIQGMLYGDDPVKQGFIRGRDFVHPSIGIAFTVPNGFELHNGPTAVLAQSPQTGAQMQFTGAAASESPQQIIDGPLSESLGVNLGASRAITIAGRPGAVGQAQANTQNGVVDVSAYVVRWQGTMNYIFLWVTPANVSRQLQPPIASSVQSLRSVSMQAANPPPATRVDVVTVQRGDTPASISRTMAFDQYKEERFRVMNAIGPNEGLRAGERVKLVR
ncbi:M48 family metalloprotease [Hyphococcus sp.]|uniref:M48 family metalloprotease n=1 Tax=Hyphococcus sp. TaxID=2038636 RepID=UPI002087B33B|nr:MAG: metalloprotease [Marinicaulis sp.]